MNTKMPHTAISTWSGFLYHGKIALYYVLKLLVDNRESYRSFLLQLDSLEDFAILEGSNVKSMHQIKAYKSSNYSSYIKSDKDGKTINAFEELKRKTIEAHCGAAFFHVAVEIKDKTPEYISQVHDPVQLYKYHDDCYCLSLNNIDSYIEYQIKNYIIKYFNSDHAKRDQMYYEKARYYLEQIIIQTVIRIHSKIHASVGEADRDIAYKELVNFQQFIDLLDKDLNQETLGEDYYYYTFLDMFLSCYQHYCHESDDESCDAEDLKKLSEYILFVESLSKEQMIRFIQKIMPNRRYKYKTLQEFYSNSPSRDELTDAFFKILRELKRGEWNDTQYIQWEDSSKNIYSPTVIIQGQNNANKICERIVKNSENVDVEQMYEESHLITASMDIPSVLDCANSITTRLTDDVYKKILFWKKVSLISLENAKVKINE